MMAVRRGRIAVLALLPGLAVVALLHRPGASSLSTAGSAIYSIPVSTPEPRSTAIPPLIGNARPTLSQLQANDVRGRPTISVALIDQVLAAYRSPLAGRGQALYDLGVRYDIDPAFCLAFFVNASDAGTRGEAVVTHSIGTFRAVAGTPSRDGYRYYDSWLRGAEDWYRLIKIVYVDRRNLTTVDRIIPVFDPANDDNDVAASIDNVEQLVAAWRAQSAAVAGGQA